MKVAVTGASGFIGRHVLAQLEGRADEIVAVTRSAERLADWQNRAQVVELDIGQPPQDVYDRIGRPDVLIHLVWEGLPNYKSLQHFETELPKQYQFLKMMIVAGLPSLLVTGTCFEYGMQSGALSENQPTLPANPYGYAKDALHRQLQFLRGLHPFTFTWARLFYLYGEGQSQNSLYPQLKNAVLRGDRAFNMSGGEQLRDYLPVDEVARMIVELALRHSNAGTVNICSGKPVRILSLVEEWLRENDWDITLNLGRYPYPDYEPMAFWGNTQKFRSISGAAPGCDMTSRIYYTKPSITELEIRYATDAATNGWGERCYEYIARFEKLFREHLGVKHAIATSSCTGALHMGLAALGVGSCDEVILGDINWIASAAPITYLGATPVLVDVLPETWCIDPVKAEAAITPRTKAIIAVHLYGNLCDMGALREIGERHGIPIIEDAAEAIGSRWQGNKAGSMGAFGTFSFHGTKTVTTGEGGMFVTQDDALYEKVLTLSNHGREGRQTKQFWPDMVGFKYKISNLQAALGCAQMERIDNLIARKRRIFAYYLERLQDLPLKMNPEPEGTKNGFWMPTIMVNDGVAFDREALLAAFKMDKIDGRVFFWPLSMLPMFENKPENVVSYGLYKRAINLPTYHDLTDMEMERVALHVYNHLKA